MNTAIIGMGSNIDPENNVEKALKILRTDFNVLKESKFIKTKPIGYTEQDDFLNGSVSLETNLEMEDLKVKLKNIEKQLGRTVSEIKFGPRTIDLDVVVYNDEIVDQDVYKRDFLKNSVLELNPQIKV